MTEPSADSEALAVARALTESLNGMQRELKAVRQHSRRTRLLVIVAIISTAFDIAATTIGLVALTLALHASASNAALCQASNTSRAQQLQLWDHLFAIASPPATPAAREQVAEFRAYLDRDFAPRDCAHLGNH